MKNPTMLYKHPGAHEMHGDKFDYIVVDEQDVDQAKKDGWHLTTTEAKAKTKAPAKTGKEKGGKEETEDELPPRLEYASKSDYQFQQALNLLKGLQIMQNKAQ